MSNIGEDPTVKSWLIVLEKRDGTMAQRTVHAEGETLSEASEAAEEKTGDIWAAVAGRLVR
jgi:hypothetical protein